MSAYWAMSSVGGAMPPHHYSWGGDCPPPPPPLWSPPVWRCDGTWLPCKCVSCPLSVLWCSYCASFWRCDGLCNFCSCSCASLWRCDVISSLYYGVLSVLHSAVSVGSYSYSCPMPWNTPTLSQPILLV